MMIPPSSATEEKSMNDCIDTIIYNQPITTIGNRIHNFNYHNMDVAAQVNVIGTNNIHLTGVTSGPTAVGVLTPPTTTTTKTTSTVQQVVHQV